MGTSVSGVGVLDKAFCVLDALEDRPRSLAELVEATGISRATAHRLAAALEVHGLVRRDEDGRFALGARLIGLGRAAAEALPLAVGRRRRPRRAAGRHRRERAALRPRRRAPGLRRRPAVPPRPAHHRAPRRQPAARGRVGRPVARRHRRPRRLRGSKGGPGWVASVGEREAGVASVSAPVRDSSGRVVAAVSVSGPIERTTRQPGRRYGVGRARRRPPGGAGGRAATRVKG